MIFVQYTCHSCRILDRRIPIRERATGEDLLEWMEVVQIKVGANHLARSPLCRSGVCDLKLPVEDNAQIGSKATRQ